MFELDPSGNKTVLHSFDSTGGSHPSAGLIRDAAGNLYGTTNNGGVDDLGVVFEVDPVGNETVLHNFTGSADGSYPLAGLVRDPEGNVYGTTYKGGAYDSGIVFVVAPNGTERVLYSFTGNDGGFPYTALLPYGGALYGTTSLGGTYGAGVVFKLTLQ